MSGLVKPWALHPERRPAMCTTPPSGRNRLDLVRIAATVHALCDRDDIGVPEWVWAHTWHEHVRIYDVGEASAEFRASALATCAHHRVWFREDHIMCIRVHGRWSPEGREDHPESNLDRAWMEDIAKASAALFRSQHWGTGIDPPGDPPLQTPEGPALGH